MQRIVSNKEYDIREHKGDDLGIDITVGGMDLKMLQQKKEMNWDFKKYPLNKYLSEFNKI